MKWKEKKRKEKKLGTSVIIKCVKYFIGIVIVAVANHHPLTKAVYLHIQTQTHLHSAQVNRISLITLNTMNISHICVICTVQAYIKSNKRYFCCCCALSLCVCMYHLSMCAYFKDTWKIQHVHGAHITNVCLHRMKLNERVRERERVEEQKREDIERMLGMVGWT